MVSYKPLRSLLRVTVMKGLSWNSRPSGMDVPGERSLVVGPRPPVQEDGQVLVEYALVLPVLLLFLFGIIELGIIVFSYDTIANAAREGARYGVVHAGDAGGIEMAARRLTSGLNQARLQVNSTTTGSIVRVEIEYPVTLITGIIVQAAGGDPTLELRVAASMQIE